MIMSTITREQLRERAREKVKSLAFSITQTAFADSRAELEEELELARIALASLEAAPVAWTWEIYGGGNMYAKIKPASLDARPLYTAPPVPVSVPDFLEQFAEFMAAESIKSGDYPDGWQCKASNAAHEYAQNIRAAMLQGADTELQRKAAIHDALCQKYNVEALANFVDWQRNHIAELEAAPPAPVGEGETAVMPDYPGYTMTQRECFQAGKKAGLAEAGNSPIIPDGWVLAPVEPTYEMCKAMGMPWEIPRFPDRYKAMIEAIHISKK